VRTGWTALLLSDLVDSVKNTKYVVVDAGSRVDNVRHTSGYILMLDPASKGNIVGMIRQMTTAF
jgi:hypothetical protein